MIDWEKRWQAGQTGWDLGAASPPLIEYADQIPPEKRDRRVLIPGCGNGYEAIHLLENGFSDVTMVDIAPTAVERLQKRLDGAVPGWQNHLQVLCADFFTLEGPYDLILEQTFFCALEPVQRPDYVQKMHSLLAPGGTLAGVLFDRDFEGGPPFGGHSEEYRALFEPLFEITTLAPCYNSIPPRANAEVFVLLRKKLL
jgi:SAM-dependent methyltransferase